MKQIAQNYRSGELTVVEVPPPACAPGGVLVRSLYSLISTGTELMKVGESKMSLVGKAKARPDQVKKVLDTAYQQGPITAYKKAVNRLDSYTPLGYSLAGVVTEVGDGAEGFHVGQTVACAGNEFALHAEVNWVPVNLCVPVPDGVDPRLAAFATVGAIALQGVRQADAQIGDTACVIGLGLVGQLAVRLLVASGVRVVGLDTVSDRCRVAEKAGALLCAAPDENGLDAVEQMLLEASGNLGADKILIVVGGDSNEPVEVAARLARDRATVVDIGKCKLDLPWTAYYEKELDVRFSRSYGPGRYDPTYEVRGIDYPAGYVRWTERRNLACFIDLLAKGDIDIEPLVSGVFELTTATDVYERLSKGDLRGVGFLFQYPNTDEPAVTQLDRRRSAPTDVAASPSRSGAIGKRGRNARQFDGEALRLGFIGAGNYASSMLLPHLSGRQDVELTHVVTQRSLSALNARRKFGFHSLGTDPDSLLADDSIDAVFIVTRHSSHARLTCQALESGKSVFVEKPLALSGEELDAILGTIDSTGNDRLMVGFNRRFSPMLREMKTRFGRSESPTFASYVVNAGKLGADSWYGDELSQGSRFIGEGGHFIDTLSWWIDDEPVEVRAETTGSHGGVHAVVRYAGGSVATVAYLTNGHSRFPKERFEAFCGGRCARLDNFRRASVWAGHRRRTRSSFGSPDKGQSLEVDSFLTAVKDQGPMPISLSSLVSTTRTTLAIESSLVNRRVERIAATSGTSGYEAEVGQSL